METVKKVIIDKVEISINKNNEVTLLIPRGMTGKNLLKWKARNKEAYKAFLTANKGVVIINTVQAANSPIIAVIIANTMKTKKPTYKARATSEQVNVRNLPAHTIEATIQGLMRKQTAFTYPKPTQQIGYMVAISEEYDISQINRVVREFLSGHLYYIGCYTYNSVKKVLELSQIFNDKDIAFFVAKVNHQFSIWDIAAKKEIDINYF